MRPSRALVVSGATLIAAVVGSCSSYTSNDAPSSVDGGGEAAADGSDGDAGTGDASDGGGDAADAGACDPGKPFGAPVAITGLGGVSDDLVGGWLMPNGDIVFGRSASNVYALYFAPAGNGVSFTSPVALSISSNPSASYPTLTPDGTRLWYWNSIDHRLYRASQVSAVDHSYNGVTLVPSPPGSSQEQSPSASASYLWFAAALSGTSFDIARAKRSATGDLVNPEIVVELQTSATEVNPVVSDDELTIYFARDRVATKLDVFRATRSATNVAFDPPVAVDELSSANDDLPSWLSPDGCRILLTIGAAGKHDLYLATKPR